MIGLDPANLQDPNLRPIAEKVLRDQRLDSADGLALYASSDLLGIGAAADTELIDRAGKVWRGAV